jgi:hypothetical protein
MNAHRLELVAKKLDENPPFDFTIWTAAQVAAHIRAFIQRGGML